MEGWMVCVVFAFSLFGTLSLACFYLQAYKTENDKLKAEIRRALAILSEYDISVARMDVVGRIGVAKGRIMRATAVLEESGL